MKMVAEGYYATKSAKLLGTILKRAPQLLIRPMPFYMKTKRLTRCSCFQQKLD